jgi:carbonic anhydrase
MTTSATAPLNIIKNTQANNICKLKCSYQFKYAPTNLQILNQGSYLVLKMDEVNFPPVVYNDQNYSVKEARLYQPSIHTYGSNSDQADAELIIVHTNTTSTQSLLVCIPIIASSSTTEECATLFDFIIAETKRTAPNSGNQTIYNNPTFSLSKFVPLKPYYSYTGTLPWSPQNGSYDYVVFDIENAITMSTSAFQMLSGGSKNGVSITSGLIEEHRIVTLSETANPDGLFYNPSGPVPPNQGEIYIDCQPTGDDGEVLVAARVDSGGMLDNQLLKQLWNFALVKVFIGAMVMLLIWVLSIKIINGIARNATRAASGGGASSSGGAGAGLRSASISGSSSGGIMTTRL